MDQSQPLEVALELASDGKTAVAVSQEQFSVHLSTNQDPYRFVADASFPADAPRIFTVTPQTPVALTVSADRNRFNNRERWSDLPAGSYNVRVYINSGKEREFDYQWLGQTYSDDGKLLIRR